MNDVFEKKHIFNLLLLHYYIIKCNKFITTMNLIYIALFVHTVRCIQIDVQFEVISFDIKLETQKREYKFRTLTTLADGQHSNHTNITFEKLFRNAEKINKTNQNLQSLAGIAEKASGGCAEWYEESTYLGNINNNFQFVYNTENLK